LPIAVLQWSEKNGTVEKRFLSRKTVRGPPGPSFVRVPLHPPGLKPRTAFEGFRPETALDGPVDSA